MRRFFLFLACAPAALLAQTAPGSYPTIETAPPTDFGAAPPVPDRRPRGETSWYAQAYGVSEEEALRRMGLQHALSDEVGRIRARLEAEQADNYADMWLEHAPEFRMVVGFVRDPETILRRYTSHPLFVARQVRHSLAELKAGADAAFAQLRRLGVPAEGGVYVSDNEVRIGVGVDQEEAAALVRSGRLRVAPFVRIVGADALDPAEPVSEAARRFVRTFPLARHRTGSETSELNIGTIVLRDGCFRLDGPGEDDPFAFFGAETGLRLDEAGYPTLYQRGRGSHGGEAARVGERMVLGGGAGREIGDAEIVADVHAACGPGRIVHVGNPRSYAAFRRRHSAWRVDEMVARQGIARDEAWRRLTACWAREDEHFERIRRGPLRSETGPPPPPCEHPPPPPPPRL
ncbi:MAG TPA: hypothetical protein VEW25_11865 [Allosphingosinicella sp.]|nr:hypothetical protein [Allosphingosinicella sp.]